MEVLGEDYEIWIDVDHNTHAVWGVANWQPLGGAPVADRSPGVMSAEFVDRIKKEYGHRRSKKRNPQIDLEVYVRPGDTAYDRLREAAEDATNNGPEILHVMIVEGERGVAGNTFWEGDFVITESGAPSTGFGEGSTETHTLRHAADSPNESVKGTTV